MQPSEPDQEFPEFDSLAKTLGFLYREHGAKVLREALAMSNQDANHGREHLQAAADELMAMRLRKPAIVVAQAAMQCPSLTDLQFWNWSEAERDKPHIVAHWVASQERLGRRIRARGKRLLRQAGMDEDWQDKLAD